MSLTERSEKLEAHKEALAHAWDWFRYHADQRLLIIRFFLIFAGALGAGISTLMTVHAYMLASFVCALGAFVSWCFAKLDVRTSNLVKVGEAALAREQDRLCSIVGYDDINMVAAAERSKERYLGSYRTIFRAMLYGTLIAFLATLLVNLYEIRRLWPYGLQ